MPQYTHQLVVQFECDELADYDAMIELENCLIDGLGNGHKVDGHDGGSGEINIFIHTRDPDLAFSELSRLLTPEQKSNAKIAFRSFESDTYTVL